MSYVPHTDAERAAMLRDIGVESVDALIGAIPPEHRYPEIELPAPLSEMEVLSELRALAESNLDLLHTACFLGAGAYHHFVPSIVDAVISRPEFYTAYTPYQPEISQGTLQSIFEYQSMICALTGLDVSNASHYDGASSLAEAVITAVSASRGRKRKVVVSPTVHPEYRETVRTYVHSMGIDVVGDDDLSVTDADLAALVDKNTACLVIQTPDFLGRIHDLAGLADIVHANKALLVVVCNPISLGMLKPPGAFGADIVLGEGQPLGNPISFGGPYLGFFACTSKLVRRMSGRLVGQTVDTTGEAGYVLTLSTREQHIRRERATSNICTNEGLNALAAAVYLAAMGKCGLSTVAQACYHKAHYAAERIADLDGYEVIGDGPFFNEFVVKCPMPVEDINVRLLDEHNILGGYDLSKAYAGMDDHMLVCVTELNTVTQIDELALALEEVVA